jgi:hypothetical protein
MLPMREAGWFTRFCNWLLKRQSGRESPIPAMYGHNPAVLVSVMGFGAGYLRWKALPARTKRLAHLRTALRVGCPS